MKKVLALVLAFAMVFSSITFAFADTTVTEISADAKVCADLGMLQGATGTVDAAYLATEPTRIQAAIMLLRLKGLEADAKAFTGEANFADVAADYWAKAITAFLKDNPELGFVGDGTNFKANDKMDAKQYAKVMLTALGYKQTSADVVGDYTWEGLVDFAKSKGLVKAESATFTVDDLAAATVEALKATVKDSTKTLAATLVEAGKVDKAVAVAAGLYTEAPAVPVAEDKVAPKVAKVKSDDTNIIEVSFDRPLDKASAEDVANYKVKKAGTELKVAKAELKGKKVILTTEGMQHNRTYTIYVSGVKNVSGVVMEKYDNTFTGTIDKDAPEVDKVKNINNIRLNVEFDEELDKASAETVANYTIKNSKGEALEIKSAKLIEDENDDMTWVELKTAPQKSGKYTIEVVNVCDDSVSANKITKAEKKDFSGKTAETKAPKVTSQTIAISSNKILVVFEDDNRLDFESATNVANYSFNNGLTVEEAVMQDATEDDCMEVILTTSEQDDKKTYTLTVKNVEDELGNAITSKGTKTSVHGEDEDLASAGINSIQATDVDELTIKFDTILDKATAEDIANYEIEDLGVEKAVLKSDRKTVELTTVKNMENIPYDIAITGIKDLNGNEMARTDMTDNVLNFVGYQEDDVIDVDAPEVDTVEVLSKTEVRVTFDEPVIVIGDGENNPSYYKGTGVAVATLKSGNDTVVAKFVGGFYDEPDACGGYEDDGKTLILKATGLVNDKEYRLEKIENVKDFAGNLFDNGFLDDEDFEVYGNNVDNDKAEIENWEQTRPYRFQITFTEPVALKADYRASKQIKDEAGNTYDVTVYPNNAIRVENLNDKQFTEDKEIKFNLSKYFEDLQGDSVLDEDDEEDDLTEYTIIDTNSEDDDAPVVEDIIALDNKNIKVVFSENLYSADVDNIGTIKYDDGKKKIEYRNVTGLSDANEVYLEAKAGYEFSADEDYTLTVSGVKDRAMNNIKKDDVDFTGSDNHPIAKFIAGVQVINATTAYVHFNHPDLLAVDDVLFGDNSIGKANFDVVDFDGDYPLEVNYKQGFCVVQLKNGYTFFTQDDATITFEAGSSSFTIDADKVDDGNLSVDDSNNVTYSDSEAGDMVAVYNAANMAKVGEQPVAKDGESVKVTIPKSVTSAVVTVVRNGNIIYSAKMTVEGTGTDPVVVPVTGVTLDKNAADVEVGKTVALAATVAPANATNKIVAWTTSDATVATVADGVVTGVKVGTATITVTTADGAKTAACVVTVKDVVVSETDNVKATVKPAMFGALVNVSIEVVGAADYPTAAKYQIFDNGTPVSAIANLAADTTIFPAKVAGNTVTVKLFDVNSVELASKTVTLQ